MSLINQAFTFFQALTGFLLENNIFQVIIGFVVVAYATIIIMTIINTGRGKV